MYIYIYIYIHCIYMCGFANLHFYILWKGHFICLPFHSLVPGILNITKCFCTCITFEQNMICALKPSDFHSGTHFPGDDDEICFELREAWRGTQDYRSHSTPRNCQSSCTGAVYVNWKTEVIDNSIHVI